MRIALAALLVLAQSIAFADTLTGRVVRVTDGDTIVVLDSAITKTRSDSRTLICLKEAKPTARNPRQHLSDAVAGKFVVVEYDKRDRYERILGKVLLSDQDMNLEQVRAGLAWHYNKYEREQSSTDRVKYSDAEREARAVKRGLWLDANPSNQIQY
jgi:endonuclease YncB( thermonuclease family)